MRPRSKAIVLVGLAWLIARADATPAAQTPSVSQRLERLASEATYFATRDILSNRWSERRWPTHLLLEQEHVLAELRSVAGERAALQALLRHGDPKVRTLALGALFIREDPRDLPLIAQLMQDRATTLPRLGMSGRSEAPLPLAEFVTPQTVGDVAQAMIRFYLEAAHRLFSGPPSGSRPDLPRAAFDQYWAARAHRERCASWFLVKAWRATRRTSPFQTQYEGDVRRVLAEISTLPPIERAWTLLYIRADLSVLSAVLPDEASVTVLQAVGPDGLMKLLRLEPAADDPDLQTNVQYTLSMVRFVLAHAPKLLRASDADAVVESARLYEQFQNNTEFLAAAARLRGMEDPMRAAESLKLAIRGVPLERMFGPTDQATLALALWQLRGADELAFLAEWFYTVRPFSDSPDVLATFLLNVEKDARPDLSLLLAAVVGDDRFDQVRWFHLRQILEIVNRTVPSPLVDQSTIYRFSSDRDAGHRNVHARWRQLLRQHFRTGSRLEAAAHAPAHDGQRD
jgi:hypothetical protein